MADEAVTCWMVIMQGAVKNKNVFTHMVAKRNNHYNPCVAGAVYI